MKKKQAWPTKKAMEQVYDMHLWGGKEYDFYSGEGSHHPKIVDPYVEAVITFLSSFETPISVCDLGCGDFNVGSKLVKYTSNYVGVDIVESLIQRNKEKYSNHNLEFHCLDIAKDSLPLGDCVLIRQVLQHLSNKEIVEVVKKLSAYKYVILTEHIPIGDFEPNLDIISGQGIRIKKKSGVNLLEKPFHLKVKESKEIFTFFTEDGKGKIVTTLYLL